MMDLREIIKWFIPCFHILLVLQKRNTRLTFVCLFLLFNFHPGCASILSQVQTKNVGSFIESYLNVNQSDISDINMQKQLVEPKDDKSYKKMQLVEPKDDISYKKMQLVEPNDDISDKKMQLVEPSDDIWYKKTQLVEPNDDISDKKRQLGESKAVVQGRTFGRPFKKMIAGLLPIVFQLGAASTWAVLAALVGVKTLAVALFILKILLLAGAVKLGALFGQKGHHQSWEPPHHHSHGWEPQKEIHLHIHNGQPGHEEHAAYSGWNRNSAPVATANSIDKNINVVYEPYSDGPQTISTPYGHYIKVQSTLPAPVVVKK